MQKRIRQIAAGKFESDQPSLSISDEELFLTVTEGQEYTGEFEITSENHIPVRGIVYSTHPRMECLTPQFEGENIRIRYQFHSKGLVEGQEEKGAFVILCNQSVHSLSFCVSISRLYAQTATGAIRSLSDFTALAKENWQEAYQLFYHKSFPNILKAKETKEKIYYQGILEAKPSSQNLGQTAGLMRLPKASSRRSKSKRANGDIWNLPSPPMPRLYSRHRRRLLRRIFWGVRLS